MDRYREIVEDQLQEAIERGEFENLPGSGKPLHLGEDSPDWWARRKIDELRRDEEVQETVQRLERERDRIWSLPDERAVRAASEDLNRQIEELNPLLRQEERIARLEPDAAVTTWRRMARLRPGR